MTIVFNTRFVEAASRVENKLRPDLMPTIESLPLYVAVQSWLSHLFVTQLCGLPDVHKATSAALGLFTTMRDADKATIERSADVDDVARQLVKVCSDDFRCALLVAKRDKHGAVREIHPGVATMMSICRSVASDVSWGSDSSDSGSHDSDSSDED